MDTPAQPRVHGQQARLSIFQELPRRKRNKPSPRIDATPPPMLRIRPRASLAKTISRVVVISKTALRFLFGTIVDKVLGRDTVVRRAARLRASFERLGGTAIKVGQQLSLRADLLPYEYCRELSAMLDSSTPMSFGVATSIIERSMAAPLRETFQAFDPSPIGSASIACVYQAHLNDGRRVAVKVRRPEIEQLFAADLRALGWVMLFLEWLTVFRPGFTKFVRQDLSDMLFEELDFVQEARYQELFRKYALEDRLRFVTAPRVYPELSSRDVLVQEYVEGTWLSDIISAVEDSDDRLLAELKRKGIHPETVARRLLLAAYWSIHENMFFHADPHPANVLVADNGQLIFIDFGACGSTSQRSKRLQTQILHRFWEYDIEGAARSALALIDPLPHVDTDELLKRASSVWWRKLYAIRSEHSPWWDRTTASIWLSLFEVTREYQIVINLDTLRAMRASLLYDTLAVRIWRRADDRIFADYERGAMRRKARRFLDKVAEEAFENHVFAFIEESVDLLQRLRSRAEEFADSQPMRTLQLASKASYATSQLISCGIGLLSLLCSAVVVTCAWTWIVEGEVSDLYGTIARAISHPILIIIGALYFMLYLHRIQYRLRDRDLR